MEQLNFTKMVGAGNDFVVIDNVLKVKSQAFKGFEKIAKKICNRKTGIGSDGVLVLEKSKRADFRMRIFNADGSEAEMCGNGLRCAILYSRMHGCTSKRVKVETKAGIYEGDITGKDRVRVKMEEPKDLRSGFSIDVSGKKIRANFINTGVPHAVVFVEGLDKIDVGIVGSEIRHHDEFKPKGANVDFVEIVNSKNIKMRTYERGVEGETFACGTGAVASAIMTALSSQFNKAHSLNLKINVHTLGGILKVEFQKIDNKIKNVYLEGETKEVFKGNIIL
ncbi:MAG: diaminopimelate epimerase [Candidatus Omnitrophica bacterium]|nr:diaminopimelate epimerase [Candidatus Omnitrophota bacterium]